MGQLVPVVLTVAVPVRHRMEGAEPLHRCAYALDGVVWLMAGIAYVVLQQAIIRAQGHDSILKEAVRRDRKGKLSAVLYVVAILATSRATCIAQAIFVLAALIWLIPDRRIEKRLAT